MTRWSFWLCGTFPAQGVSKNGPARAAHHTELSQGNSSQKQGNDDLISPGATFWGKCTISVLLFEASKVSLLTPGVSGKIPCFIVLGSYFVGTHALQSSHSFSYYGKCFVEFFHVIFMTTLLGRSCLLLCPLCKWRNWLKEVNKCTWVCLIPTPLLLAVILTGPVDRSAERDEVTLKWPAPSVPQWVGCQSLSGPKTNKRNNHVTHGPTDAIKQPTLLVGGRLSLVQCIPLRV